MTESETTTRQIDTVEVFLAHALMLENEAAEGYQEIGDSMTVHNNPEVAALFYKMAKYGRMHADEVQTLAQGLDLPHIAPWEFVWQDGESPEAPSMDKVHYLMQPTQALALALRAERQAHAFYKSVAETSKAEKVRELAAQFAEEEAEHVRLLVEWMKKYPAPEKDWDFDPDPPEIQE